MSAGAVGFSISYARRSLLPVFLIAITKGWRLMYSIVYRVRLVDCEDVRGSRDVYEQRRASWRM